VCVSLVHKPDPCCITTQVKATPETLTDNHDAQAPCLNSEPSKVDEALSAALLEASKAGQWGVVAMLAKELENRRTAKDKP